MLEEQLDEIAGPDAIDGLASGAWRGMVKGTARRATTPFALRGVLLMTLMPDADYTEVMTALPGISPPSRGTGLAVPSRGGALRLAAAIGPGPPKPLQGPCWPLPAPSTRA